MFIKHKAWFHDAVLIRETDQIKFIAHSSGNRLLVFNEKDGSDEIAIDVDALISITEEKPSKTS